ncbi:c-type cytochrome [Pelagicoccus sp. SDUM812003]|uniref:c-type cytochrome n=1 Tax=Pelagicoccus sp. SDUM812003 TaxID=3041267 RepID=UPI00280DBAE2|nr:c-type cytochrome [Pelagicoccus sp. SDUM812003]MDQ8204947.1 c-type cytochrome [Pelagicoccus sp. SDUM812003]
MKTILSSRTSSGIKAALGGLLALVALGAAQADDARGKQLYANCVACHGDDAQGMKLLNAPALSGLSEQYIVNQIKKFKAGHRGGNVKDATGMQMRPMATLLVTEEDIGAVAKYIASLPSKPVEATLVGGDPEKGKMLYMTCQACHGPDGKGNDMLNSPSLINQHDWYTLHQLHKFKEGVRGSNPEDVTGSQMRPMAMTLADEQAMKDVIAYIQSLSE